MLDTGNFSETERASAVHRFYNLLSERESGKSLTSSQKEEVRRLEVCTDINEYFRTFEKITEKPLHQAAKFLFALIHTTSGGFQTQIKDKLGRNHPVILYKYGNQQVLDHELEHLVDEYVGEIDESEVKKGAVLSRITLVSFASLGISGVAGSISFAQQAFESMRGNPSTIEATTLYLAIAALSMATIAVSSYLYERLPHEQSANRGRK